MKYPIISKQPRRTVGVPDLVGGLNLRDGVSNILDNQMTDGKNMWHYNGLLRTRPNLKADVSNKVIIGRASSEQTVFHKEHRDIQRKIGIDRYVLCSALVKNDNSNVIFFWWQGENGVISLGSINMPFFDYISYFVVEKNSTLYCFNYLEEIYKLNYTTDTQWTLLTQEDLYAPLVAVGGTAINGSAHNTGTQFESFNLICGTYRMKLSTVDKTRDSNEMKYLLLEGLKLEEGSYFDGTTVTAEITWANGMKVTHSVVINYLGYGTEASANADGLIMDVTDALVTFYQSDGTTVKTLTSSDYVENNMIITAPCFANNKHKVFSMQQAVWFGGGANGINGGSRLFLGGNDTEGSLMLWSDLNNPLYFPENNYAYVGRSSDKITTFGKQEDMLVIFKENEVYYTYYVQNTNITADDLINQSVIDYQAASVYFPIVQLHPEIGCDVPDSVQLCRNRLVWAHTSGKVYTLVSSNQYSERNIYSVSEMVERGLNIPSSATSADWNGYYCLMCFDTMWLMNYNSYGYQYVFSYSKAEDAAVKTPWFKWDFPFIDNLSLPVRQRESRICLLNDSLILRVLNDMSAGQNVNISAYTLNSANASTEDEILIESDNGEIIKSTYSFESIVQTKVFDFGSPSYRKNVDVVDIGLGNNGGISIKVTFITDTGTEQDEICPYGALESDYSPEFINNYHISPCIRNVGRMGIRLVSDGVIAVDNLNLQYRLLGGAK